MADTQRTITQLKALLPDNINKEISPQDHRDAVETLRLNYGALSIATPAPTTFADATTFVAVAGAWQLAAEAFNFDEPAEGQIRYTGDAARIGIVIANLSVESDSPNETADLAIGLNGNAVAMSIGEVTLAGGGDVDNLGLLAIVPLVTNDVITVMAKLTTWSAAETITIDFGDLAVFAFAG